MLNKPAKVLHAHKQEIPVAVPIAGFTDTLNHILVPSTITNKPNSKQDTQVMQATAKSSKQQQNKAKISL